MNRLLEKIQPFIEKHTKISIAIIVVSVLLTGNLLEPDRTQHVKTHPQPENQSQEKITVWTCSMHPQIRATEPGLCPICSMELVPVSSGDEEDDTTSLQGLKLSDAAKKLIELETSVARRIDLKPEIRLFGKITTDESRMKTISARFPGRIEKLYADYTGYEIKKGSRMADIYSPELISAQEELLQAEKALKNEKDPELMKQRIIEDNLKSAEKKLRLWGISETQIEKLKSKMKVFDTFPVYSPLDGLVTEKKIQEGDYIKTGSMLFTVSDLSKVWVELEVYETDQFLIETGQKAEIKTASNPGKTFDGKIIYIDPLLDNLKRTVDVRVGVDNPNGLLKPGMLAEAALEITTGYCNSHPIVIEDTAPLITGKRAIVYIEKSDGNSYEGREIIIGPKIGRYYIVESGLDEGEKIVTRGNFKIDSELQIRAKKSMMSPASDNESKNTHPSDEKHTSQTMHQSGHENPGKTNKIISGNLNLILEEYFTIQQELTNDNLKGTKASAEKLVSILKQIKQHGSDTLQKLIKNSADISKAQDITVARDKFYNLSQLLIDLVEKYKPSGKKPIVLMFCPMARNNAGAYWLQDNKDLRNPYYGSEMLKCGEMKKILAGLEDEKK
ncbi:MAG: efflux RND transporter periplasmic adaptor subunit [Acidobacteria bacterium]|nr:efflux RND transporter periplasmic adaptor subunit [Acidobacteriota bacterium]